MNDVRGRTIPRMMGLIVLAIGLAILAVGGALFWNSLQAEMQLDAAERDARALATEIEQQLDSIRGAITSETVRAEVAGDPEQRPGRDRLVALLRQQGISNVLNAVIAYDALESVDLSIFPGSGFAALEMLLQARTEGRVPAQVHFVGSPDEYLALAENLEPDADRGTVMLVTFPLGVITNRIDMPSSLSGITLIQRGGEETAVIERFGLDGSSKGGAIPIEGSMLALQWHRQVLIGPMSTLQLGGVVGVGLLSIVLGFLMLRRTPALARGDAADSEPDVPATETESESAAPPERPGKAPATEILAAEQPETAEADQPPEPSPTPEGQINEPAPDAEISAGEEDEHDDLLFDPDAPEDDQSDISDMLKSLVDADEEPEPGQDELAADQPGGLESNSDEDASEPAGDAEPEPVTLPSASIFRAYDIRGVVGKTLDADVAFALGRAIGSEARAEGLTRIAVARDGRLSGAELLAALSKGLQASGLDVIDVGAVPTPVLYYAAQEIGGGSGVMVTGSHNPPDYNGFKIVLGGETLAGDRIQRLYQRLENGELETGSGQLGQQRIVVQYIERISSDIQLERPLKVVADCGNGIAGAVAPRLLEAIGADVIPLYAEVDGTFPNHHPDPGDPDTLEDLKLCVRNFGADLGVAFDGDGDRLGVVAPDGEIIYPDRLMMLFARDVLSRNPGAPVIFDVKCTSLLPTEIEQAGGKPIMARTGHSFLKARLKQEQAPLAGEMSGHFFFGERWFGFDDGIYAAARLLEILATDERASGQVLAALPSAVSTPELKVEMAEGEPHPFVEAFREQAVFEEAELNTIDGVRADFADGFGLVRASNTTPVLVLRFEGKDKAALTRIQDAFREQMLKVNPALKLPF